MKNINILGLIGIIIVYSNNIPLDWTTFAACILLIMIFFNKIRIHLVKFV